MKMRLLFISLVLALAFATMGSAAVLAAKPPTGEFHATGTILGILPPELMKPAGESGRWVVAERQLFVYFVQGDLTGLGTMTFKGNFEAYTQAGNFAGTLASGDYVFKVNGKTESLVVSPDFQKATLDLSGHWNLKEGSLGQGSFTGVAAFKLENGHIVAPIPEESFFDMTGSWQP